MVKKVLVLILIVTLGFLIIPMAKAETITLYDEDSYDFSENSRGNITGGDFYYLSYNNESAFWANNLGQRGLQDLGDIGDLPLVEVTIPSSGYTRFGVPVVVNHTYVSLAGEGEEGNHIISRVLSLATDNSSVTIDYYYSEGAPPVIWGLKYGGLYRDTGRSIVQTSDGGYAIAGETYFWELGNDVFLVKTDASGNELWNQTYGGTEWDIGQSVVETSDGGYAIAGYTESFGAGKEDVWLIKTNAAGVMQWNQTYGGPENDEGWSVVETNDGGYAIAGYTDSFGAGWSDFWLIKTDASGNELWNQTYGGANTDRGYFMVVTSDGGYAIAGYTYSYSTNEYPDFWLVETDASGNELWNQTYGRTYDDIGWSVVETSDGGYAIVGDTWVHDAGSYDFWLVKTDASGNELWNQTYGGTDYEYGYSVVETSDGGFAIAGDTMSFGAGFWDVWLVKTDAAGVVQWNQTYGESEWEWAYSVVETSDGGFAIAGTADSLGAGDFDCLLILTDEYGVIPEAAWVILPLLVIATLSIYISKKKLFKSHKA